MFRLDFGKKTMDKKTKALTGLSVTSPSFFDGSKCAYWKTRMKVFFTSCDFDLWQVILDKYVDPISKRHLG